MTKEDPFIDIRPYYNEELPYVVNRMLQNPKFVNSLTNFMPDVPLNVLVKRIRKISDVNELQKKVYGQIIHTFEDRSIDELTIAGYDELPKDKAYLFIANHRDIIMDSAIMQEYLMSIGETTCLSGIGDNLLSSQIFTDVAKTGNMFTITRSGNARQMVTNSKLVSEYIHTNICHNHKSVWIAQRNGRTKDGLDKTQQSVLKMFCMSRKNSDIYQHIKELNIVPLTISYEYEPCDQMKARELILTQKNKKYVKAPDEDYRSITTGIFAYKSRVHLQFGRPINDDIDESLQFSCDNERILYLCSLIDKQMYANYHLWPTNYIAYDLLNNSTDHQSEYTELNKRDFNQHIRKQANIDDVSYYKMKQQLLTLYANPVKMAMENNSEK